MSPRTARQDQYAHQILQEIASGNPISQRALAGNLGIALGMTNLLVRRLVRKGLVRVSRVRPNRLAYFLTPSGIAETARLSRDQFHNSVRLYASARDRVRASFEALSRQWPHARQEHERKRVIFLGTGEVAEIAYVCLQETDLELAGVVDFQGRERFFGVPIHRAAALPSEVVAHMRSGSSVVVAFSDGEPVQRLLAEAKLPREQVFWI